MTHWEWIRSAAPVAAIALAGMSLLGIGLAWARWHQTRRALEERVRLAVIPAETFVPTEEEIVRFAHQLARARPGIGSLVGRRAAAVSIRLDSGPDGLVVYSIEAPRRGRSLLELGGYEGIEVTDPQLIDQPTPPTEASRTEPGPVVPAGADADTEQHAGGGGEPSSPDKAER